MTFSSVLSFLLLLSGLLLRSGSVHLLPPGLRPAQRPGAQHEDHGGAGSDPCRSCSSSRR